MPLALPLQLRSVTGGHGRRVTWLELFFDLIFVAAVGQVAEPLREHYTVGELLRLTPLFVLIWWAWAGHTIFSTRFDTDDVIQRALTFVQMFLVAVMAANAKDALDTRDSAGFAAAYAAVRLVLVAQYFRARSIREARAVTTRYLVGHGIAALLWLASALIPAPVRFWIWAVAFAIDLGTPWIAVPHSVSAPPDAAHLPERFGLFTLILLGESVVAVMQGMESQEDWSPAAATSALLGMGVLFLIWWWYFDGAAGASEQPVRTRRDAIRFHIWSYAHFPLYLGVVAAGVGIQRIVTAAAKATMTMSEAAILTSALATVMLAMAVVSACSADHRKASARTIVIHVVIAALMLAIGLMGRFAQPVALIVIMTVSTLGQLIVSLTAGTRAERNRRPASA